jgi:outer membrane receptor protein involved in Fe transport
VDMIVTFRSPSERLMLEAYGYNLTDKTVLQSANAKWDQTVGFHMPPRTYGLRVGYRFQ